MTLGLGLAMAAPACHSSTPARPTPPAVVDIGAAPPGQESAAPRTRQCAIETTHGDGAVPTTSTTEVFLVETSGALTELRITATESSIVARREYDAKRRILAESHRLKENGLERQTSVSWHRGGDGRITSVDLSVAEESAATGPRRWKQIVSFPQRDAAGHWLKKEGRNEGAPVTRVDTREYDAAGRLTLEKTRWLPTSERPARSAETRTTYEGTARTPTSRETTTTDADGRVSERVVKHFDASGRVRSEMTRSPTGAEIIHEVKRDDAGRIVEERSTGESVRRSTYTGDCVAEMEKIFLVTEPDAGEE